jgi:Questin oxidase-like
MATGRVSRRTVIRTGAAAALGGLSSLARAAEKPAPSVVAGDEALDEALRLLHGREPESRHGLSTHAPMVAEALCALGHSEKAVGWVAGYRGPDLRLPVPTQPIDRDHWRSALGVRSGAASWEQSLPRYGDWRSFFAAELEDAPWSEVLDTWSARLAPGLCAAATHGVIRTAHAVRALARRETKARRAELARGLAYWASAYEEMGPRPAAPADASGLATALSRLPLYTQEHGGVPAGNIVAGLRAARELPGFAAATSAGPGAVDVGAALSVLTATFARVYLQHGTTGPPVGTIAFVHAVTGPAALRKIAPHVRPETARAALPYAWQAAAGIYSAYARRDNPRRDPRESRLTPPELAERALANGDEHAIKFTEALLAEHALRPDPAYLAAAEDAVGRL